jgi:hypothetical protein
MATITALSIIAKASRILQDIANARWSTSDLLDVLNDGQRAIVIAKPSANITTTPISLVAGTLQSLPANGIVIEEITRNMGIDGLTPGPVILPMQKAVLDISFPGWHQDNPDFTVVYYCYNTKTPKIFYVYPPQPAGTQHTIEALISANPVDVPDIGYVISLDDVYSIPLEEYVLYRSFLRDAEASTLDYQRAKDHFQNFMALVGLKVHSEAGEAPVMPVSGQVAEQVASAGKAQQGQQ